MGCNGNCNGCTGGCGGSCGGCASVLEITGQELAFLRQLGEVAFLPAARRADDMIPVYLEEGEARAEEFSLLLQILEKKGLISLDYDRPLARFSYSGYEKWPVKGSMGLTQRGQKVLEIAEYQGILE